MKSNSFYRNGGSGNRMDLSNCSGRNRNLNACWRVARIIVGVAASALIVWALGALFARAIDIEAEAREAQARQVVGLMLGKER